MIGHSVQRGPRSGSVGEDDSPNVWEVSTLSDALVRVQELKEKGSELEEEIRELERPVGMVKPQRRNKSP
jgi:hypothetical protein